MNLIKDNLINYTLTNTEMQSHLNEMTTTEISNLETRLRMDFKRVTDLKDEVGLTNVEKVLNALIRYKQEPNQNTKASYEINAKNRKKLIETLHKRSDTELLQIRTRANVGSDNITAEIIDLYRSMDYKNQALFEEILNAEIDLRIKRELTQDLEEIQAFTLNTLKYNVDNLKLNEMTFLARSDILQELNNTLDFNALSEALHVPKTNTILESKTTANKDNYYTKVLEALEAIHPVDTILIEAHQSKAQIDTIIKSINPMLFEQIQAFMQVQATNQKIEENLKEDIDFQAIQNEELGAKGIDFDNIIPIEDQDHKIEFCSHNNNTRLFDSSVTDLVNQSIFRGKQTVDIIEDAVLSSQRVFDEVEDILTLHDLSLELKPSGLMETFNRVQRFKQKPYYTDSIKALENYMTDKTINEVIFDEDTLVENLIIDGYVFAVKQNAKAFDYELLTSNIKKDDIEAYNLAPTKTIKEEFLG